MGIEGANVLLNSFFDTGKDIHYGRREQIISINEQSKYVYWVKAGLVSAFSQGDQGNTVIYYLYKENEIFPLTQLFGSMLCNVGFAAFRNVTIKRKLSLDFLSFLDGEPRALLAVMTQQNMAYARILAVNNGSAEQRLINLLLILTTRFGIKNDDHIVINLNMTIQEFADNIRLSRESTGKIFKKLENDGAIIMGRQRLLVNREKLMAYLEA
jgi:CRP-like cAMP-binding protein